MRSEEGRAFTRFISLSLSLSFSQLHSLCDLCTTPIAFDIVAIGDKYKRRHRAVWTLEVHGIKGLSLYHPAEIQRCVRSVQAVLSTVTAIS